MVLSYKKPEEILHPFGFLQVGMDVVVQRGG